MTPGALRDWILASDPELARLRQAVRATLTVALSVALLWGWWPPAAVLAGCSIGMMTSVVLSDADHARPYPGLLNLTLTALGGSAAGLFLAPHPALGRLGMLAVVYGSVWVRRFGPLGTGAGLLAFLSYAFSLFFHVNGRLTPAELPALVLAIVLAQAVAASARYLILPERTEAVTQALRRSIRAQLSLVLREVAVDPSHPVPPRRRYRLRKLFSQVNESALALEEKLEGAPRAEERRIFALEVGVGRAVVSTRHLLELEQVPLEVKRAFINGLRAVRERLFAPSPSIGERARAELRHAATLCEEGHCPPAAVIQLRRSIAAVQDLLALLEGTLPPDGNEPSDPGVPLGPPPPSLVVSATSLGLSQLANRQALQALGAAALAIGVGGWLSPVRWVWAVIAGHMVFNRTSTAGETLSKGWERFLGTFVGAGAGLTLGALLRGHRALELSALFGCLFVGHYLVKVSSAWMAFGLTLAVAFLYNLIGVFTPGLLLLRLEETGVGVVAAGLMASVVRPSRARPQVMAAASELLRGVGIWVAWAFSSATRGEQGYRRGARMLDRQLQRLRTAAKPMSESLVPISLGTARMVSTCSALVFAARQLARPDVHRADEVDEYTHRAAADVSEKALLLAGLLSPTPTPPPRRAQDSEPSASTGVLSSREGGLALRWLAHIDELLEELRRVWKQ